MRDPASLNKDWDDVSAIQVRFLEVDQGVEAFWEYNHQFRSGNDI
jgi:hypothetical protein